MPLVSIICVCFNHEDFVEDAIESVLAQTYPNIELILIDDASTDNSANIIKQKIQDTRSVLYIQNQQNLGYCKTFNKAYLQSSGSFIIDLAADDLLHPERVEEGLKTLSQRSDDYGVNFSNAEIISKEGDSLGFHYKPGSEIPEGDIYKDLLAKYFISAPTMMFKRQVLDYLEGYDETLDYEDFDFWIRSSRKFKYCYTDSVLVKKRKLFDSLSTNQTAIGNTHLKSTLKVCEKAFKLNKNSEEIFALKKRLRYEARQCLRTKNFSLINDFIELMKKNGDVLNYWFYKTLSKLRISNI